LFSTAAAATACVPENGNGPVKTELEEPDQETQENGGHEEQKPIIGKNPSDSVSMGVRAEVNEGS